MPKTIDQNILHVSHGIIVHQVNLAGMMGAGVAKQIKERWPIVFAHYRTGLVAKAYRLGDIQPVEVDKNLYVVNLFGQVRFGWDGAQYTNYDAVARGLSEVQKLSVALAAPWRPNIFIPYGMGCGLGGGSWDVVYELISQCTPDAIICRLPDAE